MTPDCTERARALYALVADTVHVVSSPESAELAKILENTFRAVNIALVNELAILADRMGIDVWESIGAAATKPFGYMPFWPGPGLGGHCIPVDPFYLAWRAKAFDMDFEFVELAGRINVNMPYYAVSRIARALNRSSKPLRGSRDPPPRHRLQAGRRGHAREPVAAAPRAAARGGRRGRIPRSARALPARRHALGGVRRDHDRRGRLRRHRHGALGDSTWPSSWSRRASSSTFATPSANASRAHRRETCRPTSTSSERRS